MNAIEMLRRLDQADVRLRSFASRVRWKFWAYVHSYAWRWFVFQFTGIPGVFRRRLFQGGVMKVPCPAANDLFLYGQRAHGAERRFTRWLIRRLGDPAGGPRVFVDIGAHLGFYSILAASLGARVRGFEPSPRTFHWLQWNAQANDPQSIEVYNQAVGQAPGRFQFQEFPIFYAELNSLNAQAMRQAPVRAREVTVDVVTLAQILSSWPAASAAQDIVIKIDVEGAEDQVIAGAGEALAKLPCTLVLEIADDVNQDQAPHRRAWEHLQALGYAPFRILADGSEAPDPDFLARIRQERQGMDNVLFQRTVAPASSSL